MYKYYVKINKYDRYKNIYKYFRIFITDYHLVFSALATESRYLFLRSKSIYVLFGSSYLKFQSFDLSSKKVDVKHTTHKALLLAVVRKHAQRKIDRF